MRKIAKNRTGDTKEHGCGYSGARGAGRTDGRMGEAATSHALPLSVPLPRQGRTAARRQPGGGESSPPCVRTMRTRKGWNPAAGKGRHIADLPPWFGTGSPSSSAAFDTDFLAGFDGNPRSAPGGRAAFSMQARSIPWSAPLHLAEFPKRGPGEGRFPSKPARNAPFAVGPSPDGGQNASGRGRRRRGNRRRGPTRARRRRERGGNGGAPRQNRAGRGGPKARRREKEGAPPNGQPGEKAPRQEGPPRSRASAGPRPRVRSARGPGCAILAPSTARDHDRRLP